MLIYATEWLYVPNTLSEPKSWPWTEAKLTRATFKATLEKKVFFFQEHLRHVTINVSCNFMKGFITIY